VNQSRFGLTKKEAERLWLSISSDFDDGSALT